MEQFLVGPVKLPVGIVTLRMSEISECHLQCPGERCPVPPFIQGCGLQRQVRFGSGEFAAIFPVE